MADEEKQFFIYVLASARNGTLYVGVTSDLARRISEHKCKVVKGFTSKYGVDRLVHFETYDNAEAAISREKAIKRWRRSWKLELIEKANPEWEDLYERINR